MMADDAITRHDVAEFVQWAARFLTVTLGVLLVGKVLLGGTTCRDWVLGAAPVDFAWAVLWFGLAWALAYAFLTFEIRRRVP